MQNEDYRAKIEELVKKNQQNVYSNKPLNTSYQANVAPVTTNTLDNTENKKLKQ
jgi:hypothetical protein